MIRVLFSAYGVCLLTTLPLLTWMLIQVFGSTGLGRINILNKDIAQAQIQVNSLLERNRLMIDEIRSFREDENKLEALARYHFGMIKPDEIFVFVPKRNSGV